MPDFSAHVHFATPRPLSTARRVPRGFIDERHANSTLTSLCNALLPLVGDLRIVSFAERMHGTRELLELRNQLFRHLVEQRAFTAIAIESGLIESRLANAYVRGESIDLEEALLGGLSWSFGELDANKALLCWMREYNACAGTGRQVSFYGFDMAGSPGSRTACRGLNTAILEAVAYISRVDSYEAARFVSKLENIGADHYFVVAGPQSRPGYETLDQRGRDALTAALCDLLDVLDVRRHAYIAIAGRAEYEWGRQAVQAARQVDAWLRHLPMGWCRELSWESVSEETVTFFARARDIRDRAQADNLDWILSQEGQLGKLFIFGSIYHLSKSAVVEVDEHEPLRHAVAGTYVAERYGDRYLAIGSAIGAGACRSGRTNMSLARAETDTLDGALLEVSGADTILNCHELNCGDRKRLSREYPFGFGAPYALNPVTAFGAVVCLGAVTPADLVTSDSAS